MLELDHIVHFINRNPVEAVCEWEQYQLKAVPGGSHTNWGTYNSLMYFGLSYVEYLAVEDLKVAIKSENPLILQLLHDIKKFEGLGQICFRTTDIVKLREGLKQKGYSPSEIYEGKRQRDDGVMLSWQMLFLQSDGPLPYPFFIQWNQSNEERLEDIKQMGMLPPGQENRRIRSISFVVSNVEEVINDWAMLFGSAIADRNRLYVGGTVLIFHDKNKNERLKNVYKLKGDRPFSIEITPPINSKPIPVFGDWYK